jgi:MbtH protein
MTNNRTIYKVVINHEEQYSLWLADEKSPEGWSDTGKNGSQEDCQEYIRKVWTDMRPVTLRKMLEESAK